MKYYILDPPNLVGMFGKGVEDYSCFEYARATPEPYTDRYQRRASFSLPYPWNEVPRAFWRWDGPNFTREAFMAARDDKPRCTCPLNSCCACSGCDQAVHYKILGGRLWKHVTCDACEGRVRAAEELLQVVLHLFPLPDMEFLLHLGDSCGLGRPTINYSFCRNVTQGGFTMPSYGVWMSSLGRTQMAAYHTCLWERYPPGSRLPLAVWRGATTNFEPVTEENYLRAPRLILHQLGRQHPELLDARLTATTRKLTPAVRALFNDTGHGMPAEDFNRYCVILDLDGNGWSDRFGQYLVHFPTPILKAASNITAFFEHFFPPGPGGGGGASSEGPGPGTVGTLELFRSDMSDLLDRVRQALRDCPTTVGRDDRGGAGGGGGGPLAGRALFQQHHQRLGARTGGPRGLGAGFRGALVRQLTAQATLDHVGIAEAMAYSLLSYRDRTGFPLDRGLEGFRLVDSRCCEYTKMPSGFAEDMEARKAATLGQQ